MVCTVLPEHRHQMKVHRTCPCIASRAAHRCFAFKARATELKRTSFVENAEQVSGWFFCKRCAFPKQVLRAADTNHIDKQHRSMLTQ